MKHSIYSASAAHRWGRCPGSIALTADYTDHSSSFAAQEGTALHELAEKCLQTDTDASDYVGQTINRVEITEDRADDAQVYVEYVRGISGQRLVEVRANYAGLLGVDVDEGFGTSDAVILDADTLHIVDAKFGRRFVSPKDNPQLVLYAAGVVATLTEFSDPPDEIVLHIVQPRVSAKGGIWRMTMDELMVEIDRLKLAARISEQARMLYEPGNPQSIAKFLEAGEVQCQWCPAKLACPAFQQVSRHVSGQMEKAPDIVAKLDGQTVSEWLDMVPLLESAIQAANHEALRRLTVGQGVPGWKLVKGRLGNRKWQDEDAVVEALADVDDNIVFAPRKIKSPAQMDKALKGLPQAQTTEQFVTRAPAKPTLAREDDPRDAWVEDDDFDVINNNDKGK